VVIIGLQECDVFPEEMMPPPLNLTGEEGEWESFLRRSCDGGQGGGPEARSTADQRLLDGLSELLGMDRVADVAMGEHVNVSDLQAPGGHYGVCPLGGESRSPLA
jgi:hypothetical protein